MENYRGWKINRFLTRPPTGQYVAESYGVTMCANSKEALERMIDQRIKDYPPNGHGGSIFKR